MHEEVTAASSRTGHPGEGEETREPRLTACRNSRRAWVHTDLGVLGPKFSSAPVTSTEVPGSPGRRQNRMRIKGEGTLGRGGGGGGERCAQRPRSPDEEVCLELARGASRGAARALPRGGSCTCCSAGEHAASPRRATATRAPGDRTVTRRGGAGGALSPGPARTRTEVATPGATAGWPRRQRSAGRCAPLWDRRARARHAAPVRLREGPGEFSGFGKSRA